MRFHGRLLLRNISQAALTAEATLQRGQVKSSLGSISLQAGEAREVKVPPGAAPQGDAAIGISIPHSGKPGDLIAQWFSVEDGGMVVETPLRSIGPNEHIGGNNPFLLTGDYRSVTYIKNTGEEKALVSAYIQHPGGKYKLELTEVQAGETVGIDIGKLRDEQTPDVHGEKLPTDLTHGHINWRWFEGPPIVGRTNVMSRKQSISSNRSCSTCLCSPRNVWLELAPGGIDGVPGQSHSLTTTQREEGCDGSQNSFPLPASFVSWGTFNASVAVPDGQGNVLLGSAGSTQVGVSRGAQISEFVQTGEFTADGEPVGECQEQSTTAVGFAAILVCDVTSISPGQVNSNDCTNGTKQSQDFQANITPSVNACNYRPSQSSCSATAAGNVEIAVGSPQCKMSTVPTATVEYFSGPKRSDGAAGTIQMTFTVKLGQNTIIATQATPVVCP